VYSIRIDEPGHLDVLEPHGFDSTTASYHRSVGSVADSSCQVSELDSDSMIDLAFAIAFDVSVFMFRRS
jgi:hypothetical protein